MYPPAIIDSFNTLGAIHLWCPHGGGGGQAQADACGRGWEGSSPMWTSTQKIKIRVHWCHPVFFLCKEVDILFIRISSLDGI